MTNLENTSSPELRGAFFDAVAELEVLVKKLRNGVAKCGQLPPGVPLHLDRAATLLNKVHCFANPQNRPLKRVGIFGVPKQGKSSILNALLGVDILPTAKPPATNTLVDLLDAPETDNVDGNPPWTITTFDETGYQHTQHYKSVEELRKPLEMCASRDQNRQRSTPKRVEVRGPFHRTSITLDGAMLMDTPGAEIAFENEDREPLSGETTRALLTFSRTSWMARSGSRRASS